VPGSAGACSWINGSTAPGGGDGTDAIAAAYHHWSIDGQQVRILAVILEIVFGSQDNARLVYRLRIALYAVDGAGTRCGPDEDGNVSVSSNFDHTKQHQNKEWQHHGHFDKTLA
jgi:hypothetical protein